MTTTMTTPDFVLTIRPNGDYEWLVEVIFGGDVQTWAYGRSKATAVARASASAQRIITQGSDPDVVQHAKNVLAVLSEVQS